MDRLRALEIFIEVANAGSLAAAARNLYLSAPTVTRVLGDFEEELGVLLFHRTTRAITLTGPAKAFLEDAKRIVGDYNDSRDAVRGAHKDPKGLLRVTAPVLFGQLHVLPIITQFLDQYPATTVDAIFLDRVVNIVEEGFDLAVRIGDLPDSNLMATRVGSVRRVICAHSQYLERFGEPKTPQDLINHQIISVSPLTMANEWRFKDNRTAKIRPRLNASSIPSVIAAVNSGWGLTQVLSYQIGKEIEKNQLKIVLSEYEAPPLDVHLIHPEGRSASAKVRVFIDMAKEVLRSNPYLGK